MEVPSPVCKNGLVKTILLREIRSHKTSVLSFSRQRKVQIYRHAGRQRKREYRPVSKSDGLSCVTVDYLFFFPELLSDNAMSVHLLLNPAVPVSPAPAPSPPPFLLIPTSSLPPLCTTASATLCPHNIPAHLTCIYKIRNL